jgi:hypothetical protein
MPATVRGRYIIEKNSSVSTPRNRYATRCCGRVHCGAFRKVKNRTLKNRRVRHPSINASCQKLELLSFRAIACRRRRWQ